MAQEAHLVLQLQDLGVGLLLNAGCLVLVVLVVVVVIVAALVTLYHVLSLFDIDLLQRPVEISHAHRLLQSVLDPLDLRSLVSKFLADGHQLGAQVTYLVLLLRPFFFHHHLWTGLIVLRDRVLFVKGLFRDLLQFLVVVNLLVKHCVVLFNLLGVQWQRVLFL